MPCTWPSTTPAGPASPRRCMVLELVEGLRHGPSLALADVEQFAGELLEERLWRGSRISMPSRERCRRSAVAWMSSVLPSNRGRAMPSLTAKCAARRMTG